MSLFKDYRETINKISALNQTLQGVVSDSYISIYNTPGEMVEQTPMSVQKINVSHLPPGVYFVRIGDVAKAFVRK